MSDKLSPEELRDCFAEAEFVANATHIAQPTRYKEKDSE